MRESRVLQSNRIIEENLYRSRIVIHSVTLYNISTYVIFLLLFAFFAIHVFFFMRAQLELQILFTELYISLLHDSSVDRKVVRPEIILVTAGYPICRNNITSFMRHAESAGFPSRHIRFHISVYAKRRAAGLVGFRARFPRSFHPVYLSLYIVA